MSARHGLPRNSRGFTLIEVMVVVIIVAVLLAIALPAYQNQVLRAHRSEAKAEMMEIASRQEQFLLANRSYGSAADINYELPPEVLPFYSFTLSTVSASTVPEFTIRFTPKGAQAKDGWLELDSLGNRDSQYDNKWER